MKALLSNKYIKYSCLSLAILYSLSFYFWDFSMADHFFWLNKTWFKAEDPMEILSLWGIDLWSMVFGRTLIATRMLAFTLNTITLILPYCLLLTREQKTKYIYYLCGAFIILGPAISKTSNPDVFTSFFITCMVVSVVKYFKKESLKYLLIITAFSSLAILVRFPNVVVVPFLAILLLINDHSKNGWLKSLFYVVISLLISYVIIAILLQGEPISMIWRNIQMVSASGADNVSSHSAMALIVQYIKSASRGIIIVGVLYLIVYGYNLLIKRIEAKIIIDFLSVVLATALFYFFLSIYFKEFGFREMVLCLTELFVTSLLYKYIQEKNKNAIILLVFIAGALLVPSAGTDCGLRKSIIISCAFLPVLLVSCPDGYKQFLKPGFVYGLVTLTSLILFSKGFFENTYTKTANNQYLKYIYETPKMVDYVHGLQHEIKGKFSQEHIIFLGDKRDVQMLYFINDCKPVIGYSIEFRMIKNNIPQIERAIKALNNDPSNVIIDCGRSDESFFTSRGLRIVEKGEYSTIYSF